MNIEEFKQWWNRFEYSGNFPEPKAEHINLLLAEITRLTAELKEKEAECERWKKAVEGLTPSGSEFVNDPENCAAFIRKRTQYPRMIIELREKLQAAESLAAARQEKIERLKSEIEGDLIVYSQLEESKRAVDLLAEKEEEIDWWKPLATKLADDVHCLKEDIAKLSNLAARLADQEFIEKRVAGEILAEVKDEISGNHLYLLQKKYHLLDYEEEGTNDLSTKKLIRRST